MVVIFENACPKPKRYENPGYLKWIRGQTCGVEYCRNPGEPHHVRKLRWGAGVSQKPHDYVTVSRCREHHDAKFDGGSEMEIIENLIAYIEFKRWNL